MDSSHFTLEEVRNSFILEHEWYPLLTRIFTDPDDLEPLDLLKDRLKHPESNVFNLLRAPDNRAMGIELIQYDSCIPGAMYMPWAGLDAAYRNKGIYPLMAKSSDHRMAERGVHYSLYDFEDPARVHIAYDEMPGGEASIRAAGRINFWRRSANCFVVNDPDIPYVRPASSDDQAIQAYDLLAFRTLDEDGAALQDVFNAERTAIGKQAYRRFYLEMIRLQYGNRTEDELKRAYPAVRQFLYTLDCCPKQWAALETGAIRDKSAAT